MCKARGREGGWAGSSSPYFGDVNCGEVEKGGREGGRWK